MRTNIGRFYLMIFFEDRAQLMITASSEDGIECFLICTPFACTSFVEIIGILSSAMAKKKNIDKWQQSLTEHLPIDDTFDVHLTCLMNLLRS